MGGLKEKYNSSLAHKRKAKETKWIKILHTAHPYGMNDKVGDETTINKDELIGSKFLQVKSKYFHTDGNEHAKTNVISGKFFCINLMLS